MSNMVMKEVFALFDRDGDGLIPAADIPFAIRATGANPSDAVLEKALAGKDADMWDYAKFEGLCGPMCQGVDIVQALRKAFQPFDRENTGDLSTGKLVMDTLTAFIGELKHVLRNLKARLSDEEVDKLMAEADPKNTGKIPYESLIKILTE